MKYLFPTFLLALTVLACSDLSKIESTLVEADSKSNYPTSISSSALFHVSVDSLLYFVTLNKRAIVKTNFMFSKIREMGNYGSGPGEFRQVLAIAGNTDKIVIFDLEKKTLEVFDLDLHYLFSVPLEKNFSFLCLDDNSTIFSISSTFEDWSLYRSIEETYENYRLIYSEKVRRPYESYGYLYCKEEHLYFASIFTNKIHVISRHGQKVKTILNPYIDEHPEVIMANGVPLPKGPVWNGLFFLEGDLFQIQKKSESTSIFRYNLDTGYLHLFTTPYEIFHAVVNRDTVYAFSTQGLLKYHTHQFLNHD